jgi:peptidoglycan/LPS O-acetylase OafA/YrhL
LQLLDTSSAREPGLDLMRAIAILWVMLWHMHFALRPGVWSFPANYGWMGVDLFFVLSGYLIGSQLMRPYTRGSRPSIGGFYMRRAFRVLPAYLMVLLFYFAIPWFREAPGLSPAWQFLTFTENFRIDYLHDQAFSHVWSLCVEEHFYLVLPLLIFLLMRRPGFSKTIAVILGILCFGIAIRAYVYLHYVAIFPREDDAFALAYVWQRSRPSAPPGGNAPCPTATYCSWEDSRSADAPCGFSTTVSHFQAALWVSRCWPLALAC